MSRLILISLFIITSLLSFGQKVDSFLINGKIIWDKAGVTDFPNSLTLMEVESDTAIRPISVNEKGLFRFKLAKGSYILKPTKSYHWQGEEIIRIDSKKTAHYLDTSKKGFETAIILKLYTIAAPQLIPTQGILHHFKQESKKSVDSFMHAYMNYYQVPGASLAIIKKGKIVYRNVYGVKNAETKEKVDTTTLFEAGSITKAVFAFIVMRLYEKGLVDLDKPLYQYLEFEDISHDERYQLITPRLVLSHQTGFPNWAKGKFDLKFKPGTQFGYSGEAFEYLKRVIEKITNQSISQLIQEEFILPLDLKGIYFSSPEFPIADLANGHRDEKTSNKRTLKKPMMAYSMCTEANAFAQFAIALRNRKGLQKSTYEQLFSIQSTRQDGTHWGLGFRLEDSKLGRTYGHSGSTGPGFICNYVYYEALDMGYIVLTNSRMGGWLSLPLLTDFLIEGRE
jgi:CubicO group peptidase (beta-lactamase class C family)